MDFIVTLVVIVLCIGFGFLIGRKIQFGLSSKKTGIDIRSTVKEILPIAEFSSLVYHYSAVITHSDVAKFFKTDVSIPFTGKKAIYTVDGTIKLGFDGRKIKVDNRYSNIIVTMPRIGILSHEVHPETFSLYDERTSLFNRYTLKDANSIQVVHKTEQEEKVNGDLGLFVQARQSAERVFRSLLENIPDVKGKYEIVFEWEK